MGEQLFRPVDEVKSGVRSYDSQFDKLLADDSNVTHLWGDGIWTEGPTYSTVRDSVFFSDIPNDRILEYGCASGVVSIFAQPAGYANGNTIDNSGRLITCEHGGRRLVCRNLGGDLDLSVLTDNHLGKRLNSPNDVVVKSDGTIWFTDPPYGIIDPTQGHPSSMELDKCYLFKFNPTLNELEIVSDIFDRPNGLAFSPREDVLYVSDTGKDAHISAFTVSNSGRLSNARVFARPRPGKPDGMCVDKNGLLFTSAWDGIQVFTPEGALIGKILVPEQRTSNCYFGGKDGNILYITATHSLYGIRLNTSGIAATRRSEIKK